MLTGVISTTKKVKIQLEAEASDAAGVRIANGAYSAGTGVVSKAFLLFPEGKSYRAMV